MDDYKRVVLGLERREGIDYLGHERWSAVSGQGGPDGWGWVSRDWSDAFDALAGCLFLPGHTLLDLPIIVTDEADTQEDDADLPY